MPLATRTNQAFFTRADALDIQHPRKNLSRKMSLNIWQTCNLPIENYQVKLIIPSAKTARPWPRCGSPGVARPRARWSRRGSPRWRSGPRRPSARCLVLAGRRGSNCEISTVLMKVELRKALPLSNSNPNDTKCHTFFADELPRTLAFKTFVTKTFSTVPDLLTKV